MIVVADTSPLQYLILIQHEHILPALYGRVLVPPAVVSELTHDHTPKPVREWLTNPPEWFQIRAPQQVSSPAVFLGRGELEAIALAEELKADALLIDDRDGRQEALRRRLTVLGTLRVLADASDHGFADLAISLDRLRHTNVRGSEDLFHLLLDRDKERRTR